MSTLRATTTSVTHRHDEMPQSTHASSLDAITVCAILVSGYRLELPRQSCGGGLAEPQQSTAGAPGATTSCIVLACAHTGEAETCVEPDELIDPRLPPENSADERQRMNEATSPHRTYGQLSAGL
jgi:hypothetical protein